MTNEQKDKGRAITLALLVMIILVGMCSSCTIYKQPAMKITSVLAVTAEGDTLKLPIDVIRPIYNYNNISYPRTNYYPYNHMYYNYNNYKPIYKPNNGYSSSNNSNNNDKSVPIPPRIERSGTGSGNSGNPTVNNPRKNN